MNSTSAALRCERRASMTVAAALNSSLRAIADRPNISCIPGTPCRGGCCKHDPRARRDWLQPQSAASNDQISHGAGYLWLVGSGRCRPARLCSPGGSEREDCLGQSRSTRCPKLCATALAPLRYVMFTQQRNRIGGTRHSSGDRPPLSERVFEHRDWVQLRRKIERKVRACRGSC
jgi:hypothetical protein